MTVRYYLGSCEYKWTHAHTDMEHIWVRRELGEELFAQCNQQGYELHYTRSNSQIFPEDTYCRCDCYVDITDHKQAVLFALHGHLEVQEAAKR
jgi:hypothetical protein